MWCVRESFRNDRGELRVCYSYLYSDKFLARLRARTRRRVLNCRWTVEVCELEISSAHLVEK